MSIIVKILVVALSLLVIEWIVPGISIDGFYTALIAAVILGILNLIIRPILILLTLPINIITLGLFTFVINAFLFMFVASFVDGFSVDGFVTALIGSLFLSIISTVANKILG